MLAFGVPNWPSVGSTYDWWPLVLPVVAILVAAWPFGIRLTRRSIVALALGGVATAWLIDAVRLLPAIALGLVALAVCSVVAARRTNP